MKAVWSKTFAKRIVSVSAICASMATGLVACTSTTEVRTQDEDALPALPEVPAYSQVPHPAGFEQADLKSIFFSTLAPKDALGSFVETCDADFQKLKAATQSRDDLNKGAREIVQHDAERMHWCFYAKITKLQEVLQGNTYWSERQRAVLGAYDFLSPIAKGFYDHYKDSRYMLWAAQYYKKVSEWVFFRKVDPTPESTLQFVLSHRNSNSPGDQQWVQPQQMRANGNYREDSVLAKYGITLAPTVAGTNSPIESVDFARNANGPVATDAPPATAPAALVADAPPVAPAADPVLPPAPVETAASEPAAPPAAPLDATIEAPAPTETAQQVLPSPGTTNSAPGSVPVELSTDRAPASAPTAP